MTDAEWKSWLTKANAGDEYAQYKIGAAYEAAGDYGKAVAWYEKSAKGGCMEGNGSLGRCYLEGIGVSEDNKVAQKYLLEAALSGDPDAQGRLAGLVAGYDVFQATHWYETALRRGSKRAFEKVKEKAVHALSHSGCANMQSLLSRCYLFGWCVPKDVNKGLSLLNSLLNRYADWNFPPTDPFMLRGYLCKVGLGVDRSYRNAFYWYNKAADWGNPDGYVAIAEFYRDGGVVDANIKKAQELVVKSAEKGSCDGQSVLAECYDFGEYEFKKDPILAMAWYGRAAEQGDSSSQYYYAQHLVKNCGSQLYSEAYRWYRKAAENGRSDALYKLGECYYFGYGVAKNTAKAKEAWLKSKAKGDRNATQSLQKYFGI